MVRSIVSMMAVALVLAGTPAAAHDGYVKVEGRVSYAGLDFSNPSDIKKFKKRLISQARLICRQGVSLELQFSPEVDECRSSVVASGKRELARLIETRRVASAD